MYKAYLFDHDGVLVDCEHIHLDAWTQFFAQHHIRITRSDHIAFRGMTSDEIMKKYLGNNINKETLLRLQNQRKKMSIHRIEQEFMPVMGIESFITQAYKQGIKLAIVSGGSRYRIDYTINRLKWKKKISAIITADDGMPGKPNPHMFQEASKKLRLAPSDCLVFEDSRGGVEAAYRAGMHVYFIETSHRRDEINGDHIIGSSKDFTYLNPQHL